VYLTEDNIKAIIARANIWPTGHQLAIKAAATLVSNINSLIALSETIDYDAIMNELNNVSEASIDNLPKAEIKHICDLTGKMTAYTRINAKKDAAVFTLVALDFFLRNKTKDEIIQELDEDCLLFKHQILTRFEWIVSQKKMIDTGLSFTMPFLCEVGPADRRKGLDREFYTLLNFIPLFNKITKREYLLKSHQGNDCPDFIIKDSQGEIGVEITEAASGVDASLENKYREAFIDKLKSEMTNNKIDITIWDFPSWKILVKNEEKVLRWLDEEMQRYAGLEDRADPHYCVFDDIDLRIQLGPSENGMLLEMSPRRYDYGSVWRDLISKQVARIVDKKIATNPNVAPTILVVYVNEFLISNPKDLAKKVAEDTNLSFKQKFDDVWLLADSNIVSVKACSTE